MSEVGDLIDEFCSKHKLKWAKACRLLQVSRNAKLPGRGISPNYVKNVKARIARLEAALEEDTVRCADERLLSLSHMGHITRLHRMHQENGILASQQAVMSLLLLCAVKVVWRARARLGKWLLKAEVSTSLRSQEGVHVRLVTNASTLWVHDLRLWSVPGVPRVLFRLQREDLRGEPIDTLLEGEMTEIGCEKILALFERDRRTDERKRRAEDKKRRTALEASLKRRKLRP